MNISDLLGAVLQSGLSASSDQRLRNAMGGGSGSGGGSLLESLSAMLGEGKQQAGGLGGALSNMLGAGRQGGAGGLTEALSGMLGAGAGNLGGMLGNVLRDASNTVGGKQNLALGGLGALAGALFGGGSKSLGGALGGGVMALLGAMAFQALRGSGQKLESVPMGLTEPRSAAERQALENQAELVLRAMINAAKADGRIDQSEIHRLTGKLQELGADAEAQNWVVGQLQQPMETDTLLAAAKGQPELAAQLYAASLMAIEVDTPAEKAYLNQLATGMGLPAEVTQRIEQMVGLQAA